MGLVTTSQKPNSFYGINSLSEALVIGAGAVGLAVAAALDRRGWGVGCIGRRGPRAVRTTFDDGAPRPLDLPGAEEPARYQVAFVAVKAFDLETALGWTRGLSPGTVVVPLSNGAVEDLVRQAAARAPQLVWRLGYCTFGVSEVSDGHFALRSKTGELAFGPLDDRHPEPTVAERELIDSGAPFAWHANVLRLVRRKWLYNVTINTLAAARSLPANGALLADLPTLAAVFAEAHRLSEELWGPWTVSRDELYKGLLQLVERTADNENSMARDRRLGRRTESAFLAGLARDPANYPLLTRLHAQVAGGTDG